MNNEREDEVSLLIEQIANYSLYLDAPDRITGIPGKIEELKKVYFEKTGRQYEH